MFARRSLFIVSMMILFVLSACVPQQITVHPMPEETPQLDLPTLVDSPTPITPPMPDFLGTADWPAYIPAEIPPLEGVITNVMEAPGSHVRMFYTGVTKDQFEHYLAQLVSLGFELEYIVYVREGFPDNSEERLKAGDYDAVRIKRGDYQMTIEYGEEVLTYDISTAAFAANMPSLAELDWPAELAGVVPQPERCPVDNMLPPTPEWFMLTCRPADTAVIEDYRSVLEGAGFQQMESPQINENPMYTYGLNDLKVTLQQTSAEALSIEIKRVNTPMAAWPAALEGQVPAPENCLVKTVIQPGDSDTIINCEPQDGEVVNNYLNLLAANGFTETSRMEIEAGNPVSITLEKDNLEVRLMIASIGGLSIMVTLKP